MVRNLLFVTALIGLSLVAGGCARNRNTVFTVTAEASVQERAPFYEGGAHARVSYRLETKPATIDMQ